MSRSACTVAVLCWATAAAGCVAEEAVAPHIAVVSVPSGLDLDGARREVAREFYEEHPDDYDMLVVWDTTNLRNTVFGYRPVANEIRGIGVAPEHGTETFDDGGELAGTETLRGVVWMGNRWRSIAVEPGPESALGILAEETAHRWGVSVRYVDEAGAASDRLRSADGDHWSGFVRSDSPLGGFPWTEEAPGTFRRLPREEVRYSDFDLYLMGLLPPEEVAPARLLVDVSIDGCAEAETCARGWRDLPPEIVQATEAPIPIEAVIEAEGPRIPDAASSPSVLRQAWIYVTYDGQPPDPGDLRRLEDTRQRWERFYRQASGDLGRARTRLF